MRKRRNSQFRAREREKAEGYVLDSILTQRRGRGGLQALLHMYQRGEFST